MPLWLLAIFGVGGVVAVALFLLWPSEPTVTPQTELVDFRAALLQALQRSEGDTLLFVNLPPAAGRYPGSILLLDGNIPLEFVSGDDVGLMVGQPVALERQIRVSSTSELGMGGKPGVALRGGRRPGPAGGRGGGDRGLRLGEMGAEARPAIPDVERLMTSTRDPRIRDLARRLLARLRAAGG